MKKDTVNLMILYILTGLFYISAIYSFVHADVPTGLVGAFFGSAFLYFGIEYRKKTKRNDRNIKK